MEVYLFKAALYCRGCGQRIRGMLGWKYAGVSEYEYDSDDYPKGPFPDGGGEADCPQHCDGCGLFLQNPLTGDGYEYVQAALVQATVDSNWEVLEEWADFYDIERGEL